MDKREKGPIIAIAYVLIVMAFFAVMTARKDITVFADGQILTGKALGGTVTSYLRREGIDVAEHDRVTPDRESYIEDGIEIIIERTIPVFIACDGQKENYWVAADDAYEAICDAGVELGEKDKILPAPETLVTSGMEIQVIRVTEEIYSVEEALAYETVKKNDRNITRGKTKVVQEGQDGLMQKTYLKTFEDGIEVSEELLSEKVIRKPVNRVVHIGTAGTITRGGKTVRYTRVLDMEATGYWPDPSWSSGITAIGMVAKKGIVAVDPRVIPLRTWVYVEGYGYAYAADVGGAIKGNRIDLCFDNSADAWAVGRRRVKVYVLDM